MAFHILIQRSTPSLFKRFLFHFSGLFFTKNNSSFLSGTAVPSQLGTATGPPSEDPCLQSTVQANGLFSDPFLHPMTGRKAPPWFGMKHIVSEWFWNENGCIWRFFIISENVLQIFSNDLCWECWGRQRLSSISVLCICGITLTSRNDQIVGLLYFCFISRHPGTQTPSLPVVQFPSHPGRLASLTSTPRKNEYPCLPR